MLALVWKRLSKQPGTIPPLQLLDAEPNCGPLQEISAVEYKQHRGRSLSFEGFYDGVYTVAFNMHTLVQQDSSDSESDSEPDTLNDVLESILSALRVVLEDGNLPKDIQDYLSGPSEPSTVGAPSAQGIQPP